jgi:guanine deaminase
MSSFKKELMEEAIRLSLDNIHKGEGGPFGAVIVKDGKVISRGSNKVTSWNDPTAHAEIVAIRNACKELNTFSLHGCEIYTSCEPCPMCLAAIYWARLDKIYFANSRRDAAKIKFDDEFLYQEIPKEIKHRTIPAEQYMRDEANEVFKEWERKEDKVHY